MHALHEWPVYDRSAKDEVIREPLYMENRCSDGTRNNFMLQNRSAIKGEEKKLHVDPYVLGVWLGDGTNTKGPICAGKEDRITPDTVRKVYPDGGEWVHKDTGVITCGFRGLSGDLQNYGMCFARKTTDKHIPAEYIPADKGQRLELLAGLIDTDGYVDRKHNRIVFSTYSPKLKDTFEELVATFGWRTTTCRFKAVTSSSGICGKKDCYQIAFNPAEPLPCKIDRKKMTVFSKQRRIAIKEIHKAEPEPGNCISVEGGIYLVGQTMVPTHNSTTVTETFPSFYLGRNPAKKAILISCGDDLAERFGKRNLEKIRTYGELFGISLNRKKSTSREFEITAYGLTTGSAGGLNKPLRGIFRYRLQAVSY